MRVCGVCGISENQDLIFSISFSKRKILINIKEDNDNPVFNICTNKDCITKARSDDLIGKVMDQTLNPKVYLEVAKAINTSSEQSLMSLLGMAQKSGSLVSGTEGVLKKVRRNAIALILLDPEISKNSLDRIQSVSEQFNCPLHFWHGSRSIDDLLNKPNCKVIGIVNPEMAQTILKKLKNNDR
ncbi:ribosomal L7Ae/L30e/S12e/Gadd45 family protein [candidate division KSB1 bacterium]|nr:ribosomal L7Ae/L30e/S12e/Gadd45 family protein [candidate division KSB1 bacterium]